MESLSFTFRVGAQGILGNKTTKHGYDCCNRTEEAGTLWAGRIKVILLWKCNNLQGEDQAMAWQANEANEAHSKPTSSTL